MLIFLSFKENRSFSLKINKKSPQSILNRDSTRNFNSVKKFCGLKRFYAPTFSVVEHLKEAEVAAPRVLHVVLLKSSLDHVRRVVLAGELEGKRTRQKTTEENVLKPHFVETMKLKSRCCFVFITFDSSNSVKVYEAFTLL